jgi:AcrR family transcriptional regulator
VSEDLSTRERLVLAAERLMAEHGSSAVSVRDVLAAAGVANASAVGYYFGSKDGLVAAVERRAVDVVNAGRVAGLEALGDAAEPEGLVRAWLAPLVQVRCAGLGPATARVFGRIFDEPFERWPANGAAAVLEVSDRFLAALRPHLPGLSAEDLLWRWQAVTAVAAFYAHGLLAPFSPPPGPQDVEAHLARLVPQCTALVLAGSDGPP